jgi:hypothetical protein
VATITVSNPSLSTRGPCPAHRPTGLVAGEALVAGDVVYVKSDGKLWKANGTAANAAALAVGMVLLPSSVGEAATPVFGCCVNYASGMTPGARLYVSATAGKLDDAPTTGGTVPFAIVWDATQIYILPPVR